MDIRPPPHVMAWLGPLIIANVFIWIIFWTPEASEAICADSENCVTDWLGSLGGWVAAGAAYLTIRAMNEQRREADRHQREFVELEIMSRLALARRLLRELKHRPGLYAYMSGESANFHGTDGKEFQNQLPKYLRYLDIIEEELRSVVLREFDDKIGLNSKVVAGGLSKVIDIARKAVEEFRDAAMYPVSYPDKYEIATATAINRVADAFNGAAQFFRDAVMDANNFVDKWQHKLSD